jgi:hypothetical protein
MLTHRTARTRRKVLKGTLIPTTGISDPSSSGLSRGPTPSMPGSGVDARDKPEHDGDGHESAFPRVGISRHLVGSPARSHRCGPSGCAANVHRQELARDRLARDDFAANTLAQRRGRATANPAVDDIPAKARARRGLD